MSPVELAMALDYDAACMAIGLDSETQLRDQQRRNSGVSVTRRMGG